MGGPFMNSCLGLNLRIGTLVTLWLSLVASIIECIALLLEEGFLRADDIITTIIITIFLEIVPSLIFLTVPFVVGLYGTLRRKPIFLMVAILEIFILTGCCLPDFQTAVIYGYYTTRRLFHFVELLILWYFGLVWYSYFWELSKSRRTRSEPLNSA